MTVPLETRKVYNFNVYPSILLGSDFTGSTVISILSPIDAIKEIDIYAEHARYYPYLPAGVPDDPTSYDYVRIQLSSGNKIILGLTWIDQSSVQLVSSQTATVTLTGVAPADVATLKAILAANNLKYNSISSVIV